MVYYLLTEKISAKGEKKMYLKNERVRIVCNQYCVKERLVTIRGIVIDEYRQGLKISGRRFQRILAEKEEENIERPIDKETKILFIPLSSIKTCEIILAGTESEDIDRRAKIQKPLTSVEIRGNEVL